ncbi:MAG: RDD family protein [Clostridia bacterium]|nr:RDD family protein [Clostridia bacterium]
MRNLSKIQSAYCIDAGILFPVNILIFVVIISLKPPEIIAVICLIASVIIIAFTYYVIFLVFTKSTVGIRLSGLKIVDINGKIPSKKAMFKRALYTLTIGYVCLMIYLGILDYEKWEKETLGTVLVELEK